MPTLRRPRLLALAALALGLSAVPAGAATYYVDGTAGADAAAGTSPAAAWRTLAKVNGRTFAAGDAVLFRGGVAYAGTLAPRATGTASAPVVFGAYGTGRPVLDGSSGAGFAGIEVDGLRFVVFRGLEIRGFGTGHAAYLYSGSDVTFDDLYAHDNENGLWAGGSSPGVTNVTVTGSRLFASLAGGLVVNNSNDASTGWVYRDSEFANAGDSCILDWPGRSTYERVNVHHCGFDASIPYGKHGIYLKGSGSVVRDSEIWDVAGGSSAGQCLSPRGGGELVGNRLHDCVGGIGWFDYTRAATSRLVIRRNTIYRFSAYGIYADTACSCNGASTYVPNHRMEFVIANNTILAGTAAGAASGAGAVFAGAAAGHAMDVRFDNNIVAGAIDGSALRLFTSNAGTYAGNDNDYFTPGRTPALAMGGRGYTAATLPGERSSAVADPAFVGASPAAPDLRLRATSALRDTGTAAPGTGALQAGCAATIDAYCGAAPEPGAYELDGAVEPPTTPPTTTPPSTGGGTPGSTPQPPTSPKKKVRPRKPSHLKIKRQGRRLSAHWRSNGARAFRVYVDGRLRRTTTRPRIRSLRVGSGRHRISVVAVAGGLESSGASRFVRFR